MYEYSYEYAHLLSLATADRVALTCIRFLGRCPCPTCLTEKGQLTEMGSRLDQIRRKKERVDLPRIQSYIDMTSQWIFERGYGPKSKRIEAVLEPLSLTPVRVCATSSVRYTFYIFLTVRSLSRVFFPHALHRLV
jgi:hypothetical protein